MFAPIALTIAIATTGQIISPASETPPRFGDLVALVDVGGKGPGDRRMVLGPLHGPRPAHDASVPAGKLAIVATGKIPSPYGYYCYGVVVSERSLETSPDVKTPKFLTRAFTCMEDHVWRIGDLERAKAVYRDSVGALAELSTKGRPGDRRHAQSLARRDLARSGAEVKRKYDLTELQLKAILACGKANGWDAAEPISAARRAAAAKDLAARVSGLLAAARNHEKNGNPAAALATYRAELVSRHPAAAEAKAAAARIKALTP